ncbi:MAG: hypothetical protein H0W12_02015 [Chitinophagaceae bacterium]|nr:hypothetical protein [Chitinophagaceae bacterium]
MVILQIEHKIPNFAGWKQAFESDPINRKQIGVRSYSIFQPVNDPNYVIINLEFGTLNEAEIALTSLRKLWQKVEGTVMMDPQTRLLNLVESKDI